MIKGQLKLSWTYSQQFYHKVTIANLADNYLIALLEIIKHCHTDISSYTPEDFSLVQLDQTQLDDILSKVEFEG